MKNVLLPAFAAAGLVTAAWGQDGGERASGYPAMDSSLKAFNPAVSAIIDGLFYHENSEEGMAHLKEEVAGFGHAHGGGDEHHHAHGFENGFNLRHLELQFSASVDHLFKATAIAAIAEEGAELEVAEVETTSLPWGMAVKAGKFFSGFGYINEQHAHQWDFTDQPLIYELTLGSHGLNDKGVQLSWLAPTPFYLLFGVEAFQGENEKMYAMVDADELPDHNGPRLGVGWMKLAPFQLGQSELQLGLFGASGYHQEEHDGNTDGTMDHWLDGLNSFWGGDLVYKYDALKPYGAGDLIVQAEYMFRRSDLEVKQHDLNPGVVGRNRVSEQDGFYAQAVYGFMPRLRAGLRYEMVGLHNDVRKPNGVSESHGSSWRAGAMVDFRASEFSQIRFQLNKGEYETEEGAQDAWEAYVQLTVSLGAHGAHKF
jgi:hypothetical protein